MVKAEKSNLIIAHGKKSADRTATEIVLLAVSYFILINIFSDSEKWEQIDHIYTSIFLFTIVISITINFWLLVPLFLNRKKYRLYLFLSLINLSLSALFNQVLFSNFIDYLLPGYYFISYYSYFDLFKFFLVFNASTTLMHLSWEWYILQGTRQQLILLEKEKLSAEYKALMNQVNPHFLFNSLTVLYSLALNNSRETAGAIMKLSDILRYVIYGSGTTQVPIQSEIEMIENYLDLQRYRTSKEVKIAFNKDVSNGNMVIVPMVLLPLVENSFKHGILSDIADTFIDLQLKANEREIDFLIINSRSDDATAEISHGGIGLLNIEERLKLIYGTRFRFSVVKNEKTFSVHLNIKLV